MIQADMAVAMHSTVNDFAQSRGIQLLAETLLPHSLSHDCYIKQKHKSDYYQVSTSVVLYAQNHKVLQNRWRPGIRLAPR
jgi:hypothetical protein